MSLIYGSPAHPVGMRDEPETPESKLARETAAAKRAAAEQEKERARDDLRAIEQRLRMMVDGVESAGMTTAIEVLRAVEERMRMLTVGRDNAVKMMSEIGNEREALRTRVVELEAGVLRAVDAGVALSKANDELRLQLAERDVEIEGLRDELRRAGEGRKQKR